MWSLYTVRMQFYHPNYHHIQPHSTQRAAAPTPPLMVSKPSGPRTADCCTTSPSTCTPQQLTRSTDVFTSPQHMQLRRRIARLARRANDVKLWDGAHGPKTCAEANKAEEVYYGSCLGLEIGASAGCVFSTHRSPVALFFEGASVADVVVFEVCRH